MPFATSMPNPHEVEQFPALSNKLAAPKKESLYQRQKQEAEAKRIREEAENAAALETFVRSLDDDDNRETSAASSGTMPFMGSHRGASGGPNRHYTPSVKKSGPGTLGPTPSLNRKRPSDGPEPPRKQPKASLGFEDEPTKDLDDDNGSMDHRATVPKPTIQMSFLPLGTSIAVIKSLLPDTLTVETIRVQTTPSNSTNRKSQSAIVSFSTNTPMAAIDTVISTLQNRYLGWGFHLSLSRGLSSTTLNSTLNSNSFISHGISPHSALPFGARTPGSGGSSTRNAPLLNTHPNGRFAPPTSYNSSATSQPQVLIAPPSSLARIRLIHKTVEAVLTYGPEFEALLMTRPNVQRDEKWAWLWDPRSPDGVWYRWRIWEVMTGSRHTKRVWGPGSNKARLVFEGGAPWVEPTDGDLPFEFTTRFETIVDERNYDSSEEDDSGDEIGLPRHQQRNKRQRYNSNGPPPDTSIAYAGLNDDEPTYLNPLHRAKMVHLLARLPTSTAKLRVGDVARLTAFAITHAGAGAEEICDILSSNVMQPLCLQRHLISIMPDNEGMSQELATDGATDGKGDDDDLSQPTLVALRIVSDLLSASSASGVRHAWKYRQLLYSSFVKHSVFRHLGNMEREIAMHGRIRAEKWRRSITQSVLSLWEKWGVFLGTEMEHFIEEFEKGSTEEDVPADTAVQMEKQEQDKKQSRWRTVEHSVSDASLEAHSVDVHKNSGNFDGAALSEDADGQPMEVEDLQDDLDGEPMEDSDGDTSVMPRQSNAIEFAGASQPVSNIGATSSKVSLSMGGGSDTTNMRQRLRAVDMFADSEDEAM